MKGKLNKKFTTQSQGSDIIAGIQALPVGKVIEAKVNRKDDQEIVQNCILCI